MQGKWDRIRTYFKELLERVELEKGKKEETMRRRDMEKEEDNIQEEEIREVKRMKRRKAAGADGIPIEA